MSRENKKALSPFYQKKILIENELGVLHSFSMKHIFYGKMNLRLFYFSGFIAQICWFYKNGAPQVTFAMK